MNERRCILKTVLVLSCPRKIAWFWNHIILRKPLGLQVSLMATGTEELLADGSRRYSSPLYIDEVSLKELNIDKRITWRFVEDAADKDN